MVEKKEDEQLGPSAPPPQPEHNLTSFHGRADEIAAIQGALRQLRMSPAATGSDGNVYAAVGLVCVTGPAGAGKSALVRRALLGRPAVDSDSDDNTSPDSPTRPLQLPPRVGFGKFERVGDAGAAGGGGGAYAAIGSALAGLILSCGGDGGSSGGRGDCFCCPGDDWHADGDSESGGGRSTIPESSVAPPLRSRLASDERSFLSRAIPALGPALLTAKEEEEEEMADVSGGGNAQTTTAADGVGGGGRIQSHLSGGAESMNRLSYLLRRMVRMIREDAVAVALGADVPPSVLVLDDVQWSDDRSLELIGDFLLSAGSGSRGTGDIPVSFCGSEGPAGRTDGDKVAAATMNGALLIVITCRDESNGEFDNSEADGGSIGAGCSSPVRRLVARLREKSVPVTSIRVGNGLGIGDVRGMVSDALGLRPPPPPSSSPDDEQEYEEYISALAQVVRRKSAGGNPMLVRAFLRTLRERGQLLPPPPSLQRQECTCQGGRTWNLDAAEAMAPASPSNWIHSLEGDAVAALRVASCVSRGGVDSGVLREILAGILGEKRGRKEFGNEEESIVDCALATLRRESLLVSDDEGETFTLPHDEVRRAALDVLPPADLAALRSKIGNTILRQCHRSTSVLASEQFLLHSTRKDDDPKVAAMKMARRRRQNLLAVAVDQLNYGASAMLESDDDDALCRRWSLAELNLSAAEATLSSSDFPSAARYYRAGVGLLPGRYGGKGGGEKPATGAAADSDTDSRDNRRITALRLHSGLAEASYCLGDFITLEKAVGSVISLALNVTDTLPARLTLIKSVGARGDLESAIRACITLLRDLGEKFPQRKPSMAHVLRRIFLLRYISRGMTDADFLSLSLLSDTLCFAQMEVYNVMFLYCLMTNSCFLPIVFVRMMQITIKSGVSRHSALAFAYYGSFLCGVMNDMNEGYRYGRLALLLLERVGARELLPRVASVLYNRVNHWKDHIQNGLAPTVEAYTLGMSVGDNEYATMNAYIYCSLYFYSGLDLAPLEKDISMYSREMREHGQDAVLHLIQPLHQLVLNLRDQGSGVPTDPMKLTGDAMDEDQFLATATGMMNLNQAFLAHDARMQLAYLFGDHRAAAARADDAAAFDKMTGSQFVACRHVFIDGLNSFSLARETGKKKWRKRAVKCTRKMERWAQCAAVNCLHLLVLLRADLAAAKNRDMEEVKKAFDDGIATAGRHGFVQDRAIGNERAMMYWLHRNDEFWASHYCTEAYKSYLEWGAEAKAEHLKEKHPNLISTKSLETFRKSGGWRSRTRFTVERMEDVKSTSLVSVMTSWSRTRSSGTKRWI